MSPGQKLLDQVKQKTAAGMGYDDAWQAVQREHPGLFRQSQANAQRHAQLTNEKAANRRELLAKKTGARDKLIGLAQARQNERGGDYLNHWNAVQRDNPDLVTEMNADLPPASGSDVDMPGGTASTSNVCPTVSPRHAALFGLRANLPQDEFAAAFAANGNTISPVDFPKIFKGLGSHVAARDGIGGIAASKAVKAQNPVLSQIIDTYILQAKPGQS